MSLKDLVKKVVVKEVDIRIPGISSIKRVDPELLEEVLLGIVNKIEKVDVEADKTLKLQESSNKFRKAKGTIMATILTETSRKKKVSHAELADKIVENLKEVGVL